MANAAASPIGGPTERARAVLYARLLTRRAEIERALHERIRTLADPSETLDPVYESGLRAAVGGALDYGLACVEMGEERSPPIPAQLRAQVRLAARNAIGLDAVLRRYFAGYTLLIDFMLDEAAKVKAIGKTSLQAMVRSQAVLFERLLTAMGEEYVREGEKPAKPGAG